MPKSNTVNRMPGERGAAETGGEKSERLQTVKREREMVRRRKLRHRE